MESFLLIGIQKTEEKIVDCSRVERTLLIIDYFNQCNERVVDRNIKRAALSWKIFMERAR